MVGGSICKSRFFGLRTLSMGYGRTSPGTYLSNHFTDMVSRKKNASCTSLLFLSCDKNGRNTPNYLQTLNTPTEICILSDRKQSLATAAFFLNAIISRFNKHHTVWCIRFAFPLSGNYYESLEDYYRYCLCTLVRTKI